MATNLAIDDSLLNEALREGHFKTKKETVTKALMEFVSRRKQDKIKNLFGKLDWNDSFDYKKERSRG